MDASVAEVMSGAASNNVDLRLDVRGWLPVVGGALFGVVSALTASKASIIAAAVLYHWLFAEGLVLAHGLIVVVATAPCRLVFRWAWLPGTWLLRKWFTVIFLRFKLPLAVIIPGLMLPFGYESLVHQGLEFRKIQHAELTTKSVV